jgi:hypothetical protein
MMMLEVAFWTQNQYSYEAAEKIVSKVYKIRIYDNLIRKTTNYSGNIVYNNTLN